MKLSLHPCRFLFYVALLRLADAAYTPASLQSGPDVAGSSFAASATYDLATHSVVIAGSTFGRFFSNNGNTVSSIPRVTSNCFLAIVSLPTPTSTAIEWKAKQTIGDSEDEVQEACSSAMYHQKHSKLIVTGYSEVGGFMNSLYNPYGYQGGAQQYGIIFDMDVSADDSTPFHLVGGRVLQGARVTYPVMAASTPSDEWIYIAAQETDSIARNDESTEAGNAGATVESPSDELDPMRFFRYGDNYRMSISRFKAFQTASSNELQETFQRGWRNIYGTSNNVAAHVAGIMEVDNVVVVVGSTEGYGSNFGGTEAVIAEGTMSGFISKFNKDDGTAVNSDMTTGVKGSRRVESIDGADDWIAGMCNDPEDPIHIYIVGATDGKLDKLATSAANNNNAEAFVMKVKLATLETVWTKQLGADAGVDVRTQVRGISCTLSPDGKSIWFGGVVQNGALLKNADAIEAYGGDDIFVAKLTSEEGEVAFVRQIGSTADDGLAMRGGLAVDQYGNCVVVGNTFGSLYRDRPLSELEDQNWISDIFVTTISGDNGAIAYPLAHSGKDVVLPISAPQSNESSKGLGTGMIVLLVAACTGVVALAFFARRRKSKINRDVTTDRTHVIQFLNEFDVENIDLKHSATGGWHCSYSNDLANGRNRRAERGSPFGSLLPRERSLLSPGNDPLLTAPLTHSNMLKDSLFMDDEDASEYGGGLGGGSRFGESRSSHREGYDGLIDSYNSSWDDIRSEQEPTTDVWGKEIL